MLSAHSASDGAVREVFEKIIDADLEDDHAAFEQAKQVEQAKQDIRQVRALVEEANNRWMREEQVIDDTTVALAFLRGWTPGSGPTRA